MRLDCAGDGADAKACAQRDQAVAHDGPDAGGNSAPKAALDRALDAQDVDGPDWRRNQNADDEADRMISGFGI